MGQDARLKKVDGFKRGKKRRRFCAGEQALGWAVSAARCDFRSCLHTRLPARPQPVRFQLARSGREATRSQPANCWITSQIEREGGKRRGGAFANWLRLGFLSFRRTEDGRRSSATAEENGCCGATRGVKTRPCQVYDPE